MLTTQDRALLAAMTKNPRSLIEAFQGAGAETSETAEQKVDYLNALSDAFPLLVTQVVRQGKRQTFTNAIYDNLVKQGIQSDDVQMNIAAQRLGLIVLQDVSQVESRINYATYVTALEGFCFSDAVHQDVSLHAKKILLSLIRSKTPAALSAFKNFDAGSDPVLNAALACVYPEKVDHVLDLLEGVFPETLNGSQKEMDGDLLLATEEALSDISEQPLTDNQSKRILYLALRSGFDPKDIEGGYGLMLGTLGKVIRQMSEPVPTYVTAALYGIVSDWHSRDFCGAVTLLGEIAGKDTDKAPAISSFLTSMQGTLAEYVECNVFLKQNAQISTTLETIGLSRTVAPEASPLMCMTAALKRLRAQHHLKM